MNNRELEFIEEDSSDIKGPTNESMNQGNTQYDYAKILADMKKELENIPTKYPNANDKNDLSSQKYSEPSESLELNMVKTGDIRNPKEETNNIAYSDNSKNEVSEENEPYEEDFENSEQKSQSTNQVATERNESSQSYTKETPNPQKTNLLATVKRSSPTKNKSQESQDDEYADEDFEQELVNSDISEIKKEKSIISDIPTPPPAGKANIKKDDKKLPPKAPIAQNTKLAQPAASNSAKNFKIKSVPVPAATKEVKKDPRPAVSKERPATSKDRTSTSKEPKQPIQPKEQKNIPRPPIKRPATAKAALNKTTAVSKFTAAGAGAGAKKEQPVKNLAKTVAVPKQVEKEDEIDEDQIDEEKIDEEKVDEEYEAVDEEMEVANQSSNSKKEKVDEDFEFLEQEAEEGTQNANPTAIKPNPKMAERPQTVGAASSKPVNNDDEEEEEVEADEEVVDEEVEDIVETKAQNKFKPTVKKAEHKDIMKQIYSDFKKKEDVIKQKDEQLFVYEEVDKKIKGNEATAPKSKAKAVEQENLWVGNGLGLATNVVEATKKGKTATSSSGGGKPETQSFAQKFLTSLENKFKKVPKLGQTQTQEETKENDKKARTQSATATKKEGTKDLEKTWKYEVGAGINSEYAKTMKAKEKDNQKRFTELFKKEQTKAKDQKKDNLTKIKQIMNKERENRKAIEEKFVKNMRTGNKGDNKESRDPLVLQVQNVYLEESERNNREKQKEEVHQLKLKLKLLKQQNQGLQKDLVDLQHRDSDAGRALDSLASKKAVIMIGKNEFTSLNSHLIPKEKPNRNTNQRQSTERSNILEDEEKPAINLDKLSPIEVIINKFADAELSLEEIYQLLDHNGDGLLTIKEIKDGLEKLNLDLEDEEIQQIVNVVDSNTDGTITCDEFISSLKESFAVRKDYKSIMGDLDKINNPIVLEERILDMETRKKLIEEDTKKVTDEVKIHEYAYKKLLRKLHEFENIAGPKKESKVDLDHIRNIIIRLKVEIQDAEDMKSRIELMQEERMKDITENIQNLEEKIERTIRKIQEQKRNAKDMAQTQQKEELRKIFMMKAFGEIEREMETFDSGLDKNIQNMIEEKQRLQAKREEEENMGSLNEHIQNGAAIRIQKIYRGSVHRKQAKHLAGTLIKAKLIILKRFRSYKKRVKTTTFASKIKGLLRRVFGEVFEGIKEHAEERQKAMEEQARLEEEENRKRSSQNNRNTTPGRDDDEVSDVSGVGENGVPLYTVMYLQDLARKKLGKDKPEDGLLYRKTDKKAQKCGVCRKQPIERVCKECEIAMFCTKCFTTTHKSRKNHPFIEVKSRSNDENLIKAIEDKEPETAAELNYLQDKYQNEFKNLIAHMRDWDVGNAGYFDLRGFRETLKRKVKDENELEFLVKIAKNYCRTESNQEVQIDYVLFTNLVCSSS